MFIGLFCQLILISVTTLVNDPFPSESMIASAPLHDHARVTLYGISGNDAEFFLKVSKVASPSGIYRVPRSLSYDRTRFSERGPYLILSRLVFTNICFIAWSFAESASLAHAVPPFTAILIWTSSSSNKYFSARDV